MCVFLSPLIVLKVSWENPLGPFFRSGDYRRGSSNLFLKWVFTKCVIKHKMGVFEVREYESYRKWAKR